MKAENFEINEYIKEYLTYNEYTNTFECFEAEIRTKQVSKKLMNINVNPNNQPQVTKSIDPPRIYGMMKGEQAKSRREHLLEKELGEIQRKYVQVLAAARQIFSISVSCIQLITELNAV